MYWGYIGIMEKNMETTIMENQIQKKRENEMEAREYMACHSWCFSH